MYEFSSEINRQSNVTKKFPFLVPSWTNTVLALYCESRIQRRTEIKQSNYCMGIATWLAEWQSRVKSG